MAAQTAWVGDIHTSGESREDGERGIGVQSLMDTTDKPFHGGQRNTSTSSPQKPAVLWDEAHPNGWAQSGRGSNEINRIIIHVTQGSYAGAVSWFNNADAQVAAHYVVNNHDAPYSSNLNHADGEITQMVADEDIGYHDANANSNSIGIEHSAYIDPNNGYRVDGGFSTAMYEQSAKLVAWLTYIYDIPVNRYFIVGHSEDEHFGGTSSHQDPGPDWNWTYYLRLVRDYRGSTDELPLDRVVEVTTDTPLFRTAAGGETGLVAHSGERYHATAYCLCGPAGRVKVQFNSSESVWVQTANIRQVDSATLFDVSYSDLYDWLNVRDSAAGNDLANIFDGQSFVAVNNATWNEFYYGGRPTAFAHSDFMVAREWLAPQLVQPPQIDSPSNESLLNTSVYWRYEAPPVVASYLREFSFTLSGPDGEVRLQGGNFGSGADIGVFQPSHTLDEVGVWNWSFTFYDPVGVAQIPLFASINVVEEEVELLGCMDANASNFDVNATIDDGSCEYPPPPVQGCTDSSAENFDSNATVDDGSCLYSEPPVLGCMNSSALNFDTNATLDDGSCQYQSAPIFGCTYPDARNYDVNATADDGSCRFSDNGSEDDESAETIVGCTYHNAVNFRPDAELDDGSCIFPPTDGSSQGDGGQGGDGEESGGVGSNDEATSASLYRVLVAAVVLLLFCISTMTIIMFSTRDSD